MARAQLSYSALPPQPIAVGDTAPDPGQVGAYAWSTVLQDAVTWNGTAWYPAGKAEDYSLLGLTDFTAQNRYTAPFPGGESGVSTGWGCAILLSVDTLLASGAYRPILTRLNTANTAGWDWRTHGNNLLTMVMIGAATSTGYALTSHDLNKLICAVGRHTGSAALNKFELYVNRTLILTVTGPYTPPTDGVFTWGGRHDGYAATGVTIFSCMTFRGNPSTAQILAYFDQTREAQDLVPQIEGATTSHYWNVTQSLRNTKIQAPTILEDRASEGTPSALTKAGSPRLSRMDTGRVRRARVGVFGGPTDAFLADSTGGIRGAATGLTLAVLMRIDLLPTGTSQASTVVSTQALAPTGAGYNFEGFNSSLSFVTSAPNVRLQIIHLSAYLKKTLIAVITWDGSFWNMYVDGVATRAPYAGGLDYATSTNMLINRNFHSYGYNHFSTVYTVAGCDQALSASEIQQIQADYAATGRLIFPSGKINSHVYDFDATLATEEQIPDWIPDQLLDVEKKHSLAHIGRMYVGATGYLYRFSPVSYLRTAGPTLAGGSTAFWVAILLELRLEDGGHICGCANYHGITGWSIQTWGGGGTRTLYFHFAGPNNTNIARTVPMLAGTHHYAFKYDGGVFSIYVDGILTASTPLWVFAPDTVEPLMVGAVNAVAPANAYRGGVYGITGGDFYVSSAEMATAATASLTQKRIEGIPGKTDRKWDFVQDVMDAQWKLPTCSLERMVGVDNMRVHAGPGMQITRDTPHVWGYETAPIFSGVTNFNQFHYYNGDNVSFVHASGFMHGYMFRLDSVTVTAAQRFLMSTNNQGCNVLFSGTNTALSWNLGDAAGTSIPASPGVTFTSADVGKLYALLCVYDGLRIRIYCRGYQVGSGANIVGAAVSPTATTLGRALLPGFNALEGVTLFGMIAGPYIPTLQEYQAWQDNCIANEKIMSIPSKTTYRFDFSNQTGTAPTTLVNLEGGTAAFTKVGAPTLATHYARSWG